MTMKRSGAAWMPADDYGRRLPKFSVNLLVRDVQASFPSIAMCSERRCIMPMKISPR